MELTHKQAVNRLKDIQDEYERLDEKAKERGLTPEDENYLADLEREAGDVNEHRKALEREAARERLDAMVNGKATGSPKVERGDDAPDDTDRDLPNSPSSRRFNDPWNLSEVRAGLSPTEFTSEIRSRALAAVEKMPATTDARREAMTGLIERWDNDAGDLARLALGSSSETYVRAFGKIMRSNGNLGSLDSEEQQSVSRAMSLTSNAGGFLVPFQLDPSVILTADGSFNEVRKISRQVVAVSNTWNGVSSAGVTGSWDNEAVEVSDDAPTLAQPAITICKEQIFVPISIEALMDEQNVAFEVASMIAFESDRLESVAFVTGSGTNQPQGIITALSGGSSSVNTTTADTYGLVDLYALDGALPARYRFNAKWLAHRKTYNSTRQFDTSGGAALWTQLSNDVPPMLIGKNAHEAEAMDSTVSGTNKKFLVFGDFSNYVIADRIGTTVEYIPHLFGASGRPTGQRGWFAYKRVGADSVNDGAFRFLNGQ